MKRRVVVTGLGIISPLGNQVSQVWEQCRSGVSGIGPITKFDTTDFRSTIAGEVRDFKVPKIIPHKEVKKMDLFSQYAVAAVDQAIEQAHLEIGDSLAEDVGVSLGVGIGGISSIERCHDVLREKGPSRITPFFLPMILSNLAAGHISLLFGAKNYNACATSACASSNHAIGEAFRKIQYGDAKVMIAGGAEAAVTPLAIGGFSAMRALSTRNDEPARASRPYDQNRDGFVLAEGAGALILEDLEFAQARQAPIYAELVGYGFSSDAYHITSPSVEGPARSMNLALQDNQVYPDQVQYINAHGTSTPTGDLNEIEAIKESFSKHAYSLSISSSKSMTGHALGAAGALEAVITIMAMKHNFVPPTINVDQLDPGCDLDVTPNQGKALTIEHAMSNSFGFGGTNATLLFKKYHA